MLFDNSNSISATLSWHVKRGKTLCSEYFGVVASACFPPTINLLLWIKASATWNCRTYQDFLKWKSVLTLCRQDMNLSNSHHSHYIGGLIYRGFSACVWPGGFNSPQHIVFVLYWTQDKHRKTFCRSIWKQTVDICQSTQ